MKAPKVAVVLTACLPFFIVLCLVTYSLLADEPARPAIKETHLTAYWQHLYQLQIVQEELNRDLAAMQADCGESVFSIDRATRNPSCQPPTSDKKEK